MGNKFSFKQDLLDRCHERAAGYDRDNLFFQEDFEELREAGYLKCALPTDFGGNDMNLFEVGRLTRKLAYYAPPTALALNMHNYWVGLAADLRRAGDKSLDWLLELASKGEILAAGHSESGNDFPVLFSSTKAEKVSGGYKFTGRKSFGSLAPVWTYMGLHGIDMSEPDKPKIVHGFASRDTKGITIKENWDVMGMRATRSDDTLLENVFVPDEQIARIVPAGVAGMDPFVLGIFSWALVNFGNVYCGLAERLRDISIEALQTKQAITMERPMSHHPTAQYWLAEIVLELNAIVPQLDTLARDWSDTNDRGLDFALRIFATKFNAVEGAWRVADTALELSGGFGMFKKSELERLYRDCRTGRFHPVNSSLSHELLAKMTLGIDPDAQPRWG